VEHFTFVCPYHTGKIKIGWKWKGGKSIRADVFIAHKFVRCCAELPRSGESGESGQIGEKGETGNKTSEFIGFCQVLFILSLPWHINASTSCLAFPGQINTKLMNTNDHKKQ